MNVVKIASLAALVALAPVASYVAVGGAIHLLRPTEAVAAQEAHEDRALCVEISRLAWAVMKARLQGVRESVVLDLFRDGTRAERGLATELVAVAFSTPVGSTGSAAQAALFAEEARAVCERRLRVAG